MLWILCVLLSNIADYTTPVFLWTVIELSLTVISACLPTLRPIFLRYKETTSKRRSAATSYKSYTSRYGRSGYERSGSNDRDKESELPVIQPLDSMVHTHIQKSDTVGADMPREGVIAVQRSVELV